MFTYEEVLSKLYNGCEGSLQLSYEDACTVQEILLKRGFACLMTSGDFDDEVQLSWIYAGDVDNLTYADINNILISDRSYLEMLLDGDYEDNDVDN